MGSQPLDTQIKVRLPKAWVKAMEKQAEREHLKISDIARRALDQFIKRETPTPEETSR